MTSIVEINAAAEAIFQTQQRAHGTPLAALSGQRQDEYRVAAAAALAAAERVRSEEENAKQTTDTNPAVLPAE